MNLKTNLKLNLSDELLIIIIICVTIICVYLIGSIFKRFREKFDLNNISAGIGHTDSLYPGEYYVILEFSENKLLFGKCVKKNDNSILILMSDKRNDEYENEFNNDVKKIINNDPGIPLYYINSSEIRDISNFSTTNEFDINDNNLAVIINNYICKNQDKTINYKFFKAKCQEYIQQNN